MNEVQKVAPGEVTVSLVISDFEDAILGTMDEIFPDAEVKGCWFHFGQVRVLYIYEKIINSYYTNDS